MLSATELMDHLRGCARNEHRSQMVIYNYLAEYGHCCCARYTQNQEDVREIVQDGLTKVFREVHHFEPVYENVIGSFKSWVRTIIAYTAIDHFRKNRKNRLVFPGMEVLQLNSSNESRGVNLVEKEINAAIRTVTPAYRSVLTLFAIEGFDHGEIAKQLGISVGASKSNLFKARRQLQKILERRNAVVGLDYAGSENEQFSNNNYN